MADRPRRTLQKPTRRKLTFRVAAPKPRNPLVAPAIKRVAGPHRKSPGAQRAADQAGVRRALRTDQGADDE